MCVVTRLLVMYLFGKLCLFMILSPLHPLSFRLPILIRISFSVRLYIYIYIYIYIHIINVFCLDCVACLSLLYHYILSDPGRKLFSSPLCSLWYVTIVGYIMAWRLCSFDCALHSLHPIVISMHTRLRALLSIKCMSSIFYRACV